MPESGNNKGIAAVKVKILNRAPNITKMMKYNFDTGAFAWDQYSRSPFFYPLLTEHIQDGDSFSAMYPSKRIWYVNNFLEGEDAALSYGGTDPYVLWRQIDPSAVTPSYGTIHKIITPVSESKAGANDGYAGFDKYPLINPGGYSSMPPDYKGPIWNDNAIEKEPYPDDFATIKAFADLYEIPDIDFPSVTPTLSELIPWTGCISQNTVRDGLWWGCESSPFLEENMPFFVTFKKMFPPSSADHETFIIISLGVNDTDNEQRFDLYLGLNKKPILIDYISSDTSGAKENWKECEMESTRQLSYNEDLQIGFMVIAGRLIVFVDGSPMVYTRVNSDKGEDACKLLECKIHPGSIRIFGSNMQCRINVSPMTFAPLSLTAIQIPTIVNDSGDSTVSLHYEGVNYAGEPVGSVCELPTPPSYPKQLYGVDCYDFYSGGVNVKPNGFGFHQFGYVRFVMASEKTFKALPSTDFYALSMVPESTTFGGKELPRGGAPYFFRLKGVSIPSVENEGGDGFDVSDFVISVDETNQAPDYFHCKKSATVTLYNENGAITNTISGLTKGNTAIEISWAWTDAGSYPSNLTKTFTGIVTSVSKTEEPGFETVTLNCEDYMYILNNVMIINSPFYDGMVAFYAIKDLAERAGCKNIINDWQSPVDYFLPAGFAFSKPAMRWGSRDKIFSCIIEIAKRYEAFVRFDEDGKLVVEKLPGGLFSEFIEDGIVPSTIDFKSEPSAEHVILNKRVIDYNFDSTINNISILTVERDTRNAVIYGKTAKRDEDNLMFRKTYLYDQPALGELEAAKSFAAELSKRIFYPILKTQVETVGGSTFALIPLSFVTVDGKEFRVMSVKRKFNADSNDYTESFEAEWLGGK